MAETTTYSFSFAEIVEALLKKQGIHEGIWAIQVKFGLAATNIREDDNSAVAFPSAIVPIKEIGLRKADKVENGLSVDAAKVNPKSGGTRRVKKPAHK